MHSPFLTETNANALKLGAQSFDRCCYESGTLVFVREVIGFMKKKNRNILYNIHIVPQRSLTRRWHSMAISCKALEAMSDKAAWIE